jgi:hypothetical protein
VPEKKWAALISLLAQREADRKTKILRPSKFEKMNAKVDETEQVKTNELVNLTAEVKKEANPKAHPNLTTGTTRKAIRPNLRKAIFHQHRGCGYTDPATGKVCASTRFSQIDHRQSVWAGGQNEPRNLQVLCSQHNRLKYRKEVGLHP